MDSKNGDKGLHFHRHWGSSAGLLNHVNNNTHFTCLLLTMIHLADEVYST